jgi:hypothetical protein
VPRPGQTFDERWDPLFRALRGEPQRVEMRGALPEERRQRLLGLGRELAEKSLPARLQLLASLTGRPAISLRGVAREQAIGELGEQLALAGVDPQAADEIRALFSDSGPLAKLRGEVERMSGRWSEAAFGERALSLSSELTGEELSQARAEAPLLEALRASPTWTQLAALLGVPEERQEVPVEAELDAELEPRTWAARFDFALGAMQDVPWQERRHETIRELFEGATRAARRKETRRERPSPGAPPPRSEEFLREVLERMSQRSRLVAGYSRLAEAMESGAALPANELLRGDSELLLEQAERATPHELLTEWTDLARFKRLPSAERKREKKALVGEVRKERREALQKALPSFELAPVMARLRKKLAAAASATPELEEEVAVEKPKNEHEVEPDRSGGE